MKSVRRLVVLIIIGGTIISLLAARSVADARSGAVERALEQEAAAIGDELERLSTGAFSAVVNLGDIVASDWQTAEEYRLLWPSYQDAVPGDSSALLLAGTSSNDLEFFLEGQQRFDSGFTPAIVNQAPAETGHVFIVAASDETQPVGADLSSIPGAVDIFFDVEPGTVTVRGADLRSPVSVPPGQAQLIYRTSAERLDGFAGEIWNVVQVDGETLLQMVLSNHDGFGASLTLNVNDQIVYGGIPLPGSLAQTSTGAATEGLEFNLEVWTDGTSVVSRSPLSVFVAALASVLGFAALVGLSSTAYVLARRAESGEREARHDELTSLPNRRWVTETLQASSGNIAVMFCDLDRFKVVNDSVGHSAGDELLMRVSERIAAIVGDRGSVARFGGDEFIVVVNEPDGVEGRAAEIADELVVSMREPFTLAAGSFRTSVSVGLASGNTRDITGDELIRAADVALGRAKSSGRDSVVIYDDELREAELDRLKLESELQTALDNEDLTIRFQPIVDAKKQLRSYEALVRWDRCGELLAPAGFLPVVEEMGRMADLGKIVLRKAIKIFAEATTEHDATTLHINVDASQLLDPSFPQTVRDTIEEFDLDPSRLILELTEGEWVDSNADLEIVLAELAEGGFGFAIDDFGSGYSSLARLLTVPGLAEIKIDRAMVKRSMDPRTGAIVAGLVEIAERLEVTLVAEGVEKTEEFAILRRAGVPQFQGYLFGYPAELSAQTHAGAARPDGDRRFIAESDAA